jgi:hypothetical protein
MSVEQGTILFRPDAPGSASGTHWVVVRAADWFYPHHLLVKLDFNVAAKPTPETLDREYCVSKLNGVGGGLHG